VFPLDLVAHIRLGPFLLNPPRTLGLNLARLRCTRSGPGLLPRLLRPTRIGAVLHRVPPNRLDAALLRLDSCRGPSSRLGAALLRLDSCRGPSSRLDAALP
jgi:hypothetical protein